MNPRLLRAAAYPAVSACALLSVACGGVTPAAVPPTTLPPIGVVPVADKPHAPVLDPRLNEEYLLAQGIAVPKADGYQSSTPPTLLGIGAKDPTSEVLVVAGMSRWTLRGRDVKTGPAFPEPIEGVLAVPARFGGGYLFFGAKWLWRTETPLGPAKPFVYHAGDAVAPVFGEDALFLRASRSDLIRAFRMTDGSEITSVFGNHASLFRIGDTLFSFTSAGATVSTGKGPPKPIVTTDGKIFQLQPTPTGAVATTGKRTFDVDVTGTASPRNDGDPFPMNEEIPALPPEHLVAQGAVHLFPDGTILGEGDAVPFSELANDDREERPSSVLRLFPRGAIESHQPITIASESPENCRLFDGEGPTAHVVCTPRESRGTRILSLRSDGSHGPPELSSTSENFDEGPGPEGAPVYWSSSCSGDRQADKWCVPNGDKWTEIDMPPAPSAGFGMPGPNPGGGKMAGVQRFYFADSAYATGDGAMTLLRRGEKEWRVERADGTGTRLLYSLPAPKLAQNYRVLSATSGGSVTLLQTVEDDGALGRSFGTSGARIVRLDENGLVELANLKRAGNHGRRILGVDTKDRLVESSDSGAHFRVVGAPPGGAPNIERCTAAGCFLGPLFRVWDGSERGFAWPVVAAGEVPPAPAALAPATITCKLSGGPAKDALISTSEAVAPEAPAMFPMMLAAGSLVRGGTLATATGTEFRVLLPFDASGGLRSYLEPASTVAGRSFRFMLPALPTDLGTPGALIWGRPGPTPPPPAPGMMMGPRYPTQQAGFYIGNKSEAVQGVYDYAIGRLTTKGDTLAPFYGNGMAGSEMKYSLQRVADGSPSKGVSYTDPIVALRGGRAEVVERVGSNLPPTVASPIRAGSTALPPWSTLRALGAPGCTGDGVRMLLEIPVNWLAIAWDGASKPGSANGGIAVVRATKDRLCLEAIDVALATTDPSARLVAKEEAAPVRYAIARFGPSAAGQLATFHVGKFRSEPMTCTLAP